MAKQPQDREDLMRDASNLTQRIELRVTGVEPLVVCGFRDDGSLSIYWGQDEVIQFNSLAELRRGFWQERIIATYRHELHWLTRGASEGRAKLNRERFSESDQREYLELVQARLEQLHSAVDTGAGTVTRQHPLGAAIDVRLRDWLATHRKPLRLAMHPGLARVKQE